MTRRLAPDALTTPRMRGEPVGPQHQDVMLALLADPRVGATMGGAATAQDVAEEIAWQAGAWERDAFGFWMLFESVSGDPVARGGLGRTEFDGEQVVEVAWTVMPDRWGEGFATELGAAAVQVAFGDLGLAEVVAFTLPDNAASRRVMEKLGFVYEKTAPYKTYGDHVLYRRRP